MSMSKSKVRGMGFNRRLWLGHQGDANPRTRRNQNPLQSSFTWQRINICDEAFTSLNSMLLYRKCKALNMPLTIAKIRGYVLVLKLWLERWLSVLCTKIKVLLAHICIVEWLDDCFFCFTMLIFGEETYGEFEFLGLNDGVSPWSGTAVGTSDTA